VLLFVEPNLTCWVLLLDLAVIGIWEVIQHIWFSTRGLNRSEGPFTDGCGGMRFPIKHHICSTLSVLRLIIVTLIWIVLQLLVSQLPARKCVNILLFGPDREVLHIQGIATALTIIVYVMRICPQLLQFGLGEWLKSLTFVTINTLAQLRSHLDIFLTLLLFENKF